MSGTDHGTSSTIHSEHSHLAHHFETPQQQYESGKQGMWLFLATEILLFGGLFCAYAVYRRNQPEIFYYGHQFLSVKWGGINTVVLIFSSFTMAWSVRAAQLGQNRTLIACLILTLLCACGFLGIKGIEYHEKWKHGLLWASRYKPVHHPEAKTQRANVKGPEGEKANLNALAAKPAATALPGTTLPTTATLTQEKTTLPQPATPPQGTVMAAVREEEAAIHGEPKKAAVFFSIYFAMTGLHGLHVIAGMIAILWVLFRAMRRQFGPAYFAPVDFVGLYWHLVDMIWIFLFPLLYLIH